MTRFARSRLTPNTLRLLATLLMVQSLAVALLVVGREGWLEATGAACTQIQLPADFPADIPLEGSGPESHFYFFPIGATCTFQREAGESYVLDLRSWSATALAILGLPVGLTVAASLLIAARHQSRMQNSIRNLQAGD